MAKAQAARTHCPHGHEYTPENTCVSTDRRHCLACGRDRHRVQHPPRTLAETVWSRIVRDASGCWLWTGGRSQEGYGTLSGRLAHRVVYELLVEPIPDGLVLDHVYARGCRHRHCVNPSHLEIVTLAENVRRGSIARRSDHCPRGHLFDAENTHLRPDTGWRSCRACNRERQRERLAASHRGGGAQ